MNIHSNTSCPVTPGKLTPPLSLADLGSGDTRGSRYHGVCANVIVDQSTGTVEHTPDGRCTRLQDAGFPYKMMKRSELTVLMVAFAREYVYSIKCILTHNGLIEM